MITTTFHYGILSPDKVACYHQASLACTREVLENYRRNRSSPYLFLGIPENGEAIINTVRAGIHNVPNTRPVDIVLVVGIGGSALGTQAVYSALYHHRGPGAPELWCADTIDPVTTHELLKKMECALDAKKNIIMVIISKSGTTLETCSNAALFGELLRTKVADSKRHIIVVTDPGSPLEEYAHREGLSYVNIPPALGGRFSVCSAVGLVPLMVLGMDGRGLLRGALQATSDFNNAPERVSDHVAMIAAAYDAGYRVHDTFVTAPHLMAYGAWYRQLLAESLGKCDTTAGNERRVGMVPTVSCIASDLHSMAQLYLAGPRNILTTFFDMPCSQLSTTPALWVSPIANAQSQAMTVSAIHRALCTAMYKAYDEAQLPNMRSISSECCAETIGYSMQQQMIIITILGHLWRINPFDQPEVGNYKKWVRYFMLS